MADRDSIEVLCEPQPALGPAKAKKVRCRTRWTPEGFFSGPCLRKADPYKVGDYSFCGYSAECLCFRVFSLAMFIVCWAFVILGFALSRFE